VAFGGALICAAALLAARSPGQEVAA
jgi:hypothetical protein